MRRNPGAAAKLSLIHEKSVLDDGRLLTERDQQDIRSQLEGFDSISAINDEMRDVIGGSFNALDPASAPPEPAPPSSRRRSGLD